MTNIKEKELFDTLDKVLKEHELDADNDNSGINLNTTVYFPVTSGEVAEN